MDAVDHCLGFLAGRHFSNVGSHGAVGKEHEFLNELVGLFRHVQVHSSGHAVLVDVEVFLFAVKLHGTLVKALLAQLLRQVVEGENLFYKVALASLDYLLGLLIAEAAVAIDHRVANLVFIHLGIVVHLKYHRVAQLVLVRSERAYEVAQALRQHGHGAVNEVDRCGA